MSWLVVALALVAVGITAGFAHQVLHSLRTLPQLPDGAMAPSSDGVALGVVVPARDEVGSIGATIERVADAVAAYPGVEHARIVVVDDRSTDGTGAAARAAADRYPRHAIQVIDGQPPPRGWTGKAWACQQAIDELGPSAYSHLLFLDGDIEIAPPALRYAFAALTQQNLGLLSLYPRVVCQSWAEQAVQPLMVANLLAGFPPEAVADPDSPEAMAIGGFMLFATDAYHDAGGHPAVAGAAVDDMRLAQLTKAAGHGVQLADGTHLLRVRMYESLPDLWAGWVKNLYPGSQRPLKMAFIALVMVVVHSLGWVLLLASPAVGGSLLATGIVAGLAAGQLGLHGWMYGRLIRTMRTEQARWGFAPFGGLLLAAMIGASIYHGTLGRGHRWRGDRIPGTEQEEG